MYSQSIGTGSGSVTGISLSSDPPSSPVAVRLGELQQAVRLLDQSVDMLFGRLAPALRIDPPNVAQSGGQAVPSPVCSPIAATLSDVINHVQAVHARVDVLGSRIEL